MRYDFSSTPLINWAIKNGVKQTTNGSNTSSFRSRKTHIYNKGLRMEVYVNPRGNPKELKKKYRTANGMYLLIRIVIKKGLHSFIHASCPVPLADSKPFHYS